MCECESMWLGWIRAGGWQVKLGAWRLGAPSARDPLQRHSSSFLSTNYNERFSEPARWCGRVSTPRTADHTREASRCFAVKVGPPFPLLPRRRRRRERAREETKHSSPSVTKHQKPSWNQFMAQICRLSCRYFRPILLYPTKHLIRISLPAIPPRHRPDPGNYVPFHAQMPLIAMALADGVYLEIP